MAVIKKTKNNIPVILENIDHVKSLSIGVFVKTGSKHEKSDESGISHFVEHMLFKGTKNKTAQEITERIDQIGGNINAFTNKEMTGFHITLLSEHIQVAIETLSDIIINSTFPKKEIEKEKKVIIEEIKMYKDIPEEELHDLNFESVLKDSGIANSVLGTIESVSKITQEDLIDYWKERYAPENLVISISGQLDLKKAFSSIEDSFMNLNRDFIPRDYNKSYKYQKVDREYLRDINQVHLYLNTPGFSYFDQDRYTLSVLGNILGGNMSSRLFQEVREKEGLAYSIHSRSSSYEEGGLFMIYAATTKDDYNKVVNIIKRELEKVTKEGVLDKEIQRARNQIKSALILSMESTRSRMKRMASSYLFHKKLRTIEDIIKKVEKVTKKDISRVANDMFKEDKYSVTLLGNIKEN